MGGSLKLRLGMAISWFPVPLISTSCLPDYLINFFFFHFSLLILLFPESLLARRTYGRPHVVAPLIIFPFFLSLLPSYPILFPLLDKAPGKGKSMPYALVLLRTMNYELNTNCSLTDNWGFRLKTPPVCHSCEGRNPVIYDGWQPQAQLGDGSLLFM